MPFEVISDESTRHYGQILIWTGAVGDGSLYTLGNWLDAAIGTPPLVDPETVVTVQSTDSTSRTVADAPQVVAVKPRSFSEGKPEGGTVC